MNKLWYAIMENRNDTDWGHGTYSVLEAYVMLIKEEKRHPDAYVLVIDESGDDPECIDELRSDYSFRMHIREYGI